MRLCLVMAVEIAEYYCNIINLYIINKILIKHQHLFSFVYLLFFALSWS